MSKIFIGGSKSIKTLPPTAMKKLNSFCNDGVDIIIGDAFGVDKAVQEYLASANYPNVTIYASGGKVRNYVGNWHIVAVQTEFTSGYDFYKQKDIAMANDCDYGFMIWDGKSRGALNNITRLVEHGKTCKVYFNSNKREYVITNREQLDKLLAMVNMKLEDVNEQVIPHKPVEAIMAIADKFAVDSFQIGSMFILPDGKLLYMQNGHQSLFDEIQTSIPDCKTPAVTLTKLGWIRLNTQVKYINLQGITPTAIQSQLVEQAITFMSGDVQIIK